MRLTALAFSLFIALPGSLLAAEEQTKNSSAAKDQKHIADRKAGLKLFKDEVREILVSGCVDCHGGRSTKGDFDISSRKKLVGSGFVEKQAEGSYLLELIRHEAEPFMPFKKDKLTDQQIAAIAKWLDLGAPYDKPLVEQTESENAPMVVTDEDRKFWSFQPLRAGDPTTLDDSAWCQTPVDRFIFRDLAEQKLQPNPIASREALIRRAYLDLIGIPPTPQQVSDFLADANSTPVAFAKVIDQLLDSQHYGERWARHWMDVARFAESEGFEHDYDRNNAYHYRDFLIQAFNQDMPWDQMVRWQLAGDELAPDDALAMMATGFLSAGVFPTQLTENEFESARYDELDDMVATMGVAFLGLSVGCARCHDHKFDPIPTRDYYGLVASFATAIRAEVPIAFGSEKYEEELKQWTGQRDLLDKAFHEYDSTSGEAVFQKALAQPDLIRQPSQSQWNLISDARVSSREGVTLTRQSNGAWLASGKNPGSDEYTMVANVSAGARSLRIEALTHKSMPRGGPGRAGNGNFGLGNLTVHALATGSAQDAKPIAINLINPRATHQQNTGGLSIASSIDGDINKSGWAVDFGGIGKDQAAIFDFETPLTEDSELTIKMRFHVNTQHTFGHFRLSTSDRPGADFELKKGIPAELGSAIQIAKKGESDKLNDSQRRALREYILNEDKGWVGAKAKLDAHAAMKPKADVKQVMVCSEGVKPRKHHADGRGYPHFYKDVHLLKRGDPRQKQELMSPGYLTVLWADPQSHRWQPQQSASPLSRRRSTLASWITDPEKGAGELAARVIANRLWQHHFGRGIVSTPNDFGFQGARPTHPELLDWLAADLIDGGWKLKRLHKLIMTSSVYMQNTKADQKRVGADPDNMLWWRFNGRRLEAEAIRDSLLAVSGQLDRSLYGPSTLNEASMRRSVYFRVKRSKFIPLMQVFDWPEHLVSIGQRSNTAIAPQALALMNSPHVRGYAESFAKRISDGNTIEQAVQHAYTSALARRPSELEMERAADFINGQSQFYGSDAKAVSTAIADFCHALFCTTEFLHLP